MDTAKVPWRGTLLAVQPRICLTRKAPGRKGMQWEEEDWVDEENTAHRGTDD